MELANSIYINKLKNITNYTAITASKIIRNYTNVGLWTTRQSMGLKQLISYDVLQKDSIMSTLYTGPMI